MQIPTGNFGFAEQNPQSNVVRNPGNANLQAVQQLGATVAGAGLDIINRQRQEEERQRRIKEAEAKQEQDRADRAATITAQVRTQNGLSDLADEIGAGLQNGTLDADGARKSFAERSKTLFDQHIGQAPESYRGILQAEAEGWAGRAANGLEDRIRVHGQQKIGAELTTVGEELQRAARKDITGATKQFESTMDVLGPQAGMRPEQIAASKQKFREQTRYTQAYDALTQAGENVGQLRDLSKRLTSDEFNDIDPQRRAALDSSIQSRIATLENRAAIRQQASLSRAEAAYTSFAQYMDGGRQPTEQYTQQVISRVKGTPYEAAVMETIKQAPQQAAFASMPLDQQQQALTGMLAQMNTQGSSPAIEAQYKKREAALRATQADIERDPILAAQERNVVRDFAPLNPADVATLPDQIAARQGVVSRVSVWAGQPVSPFTKAEAVQIGDTLSSLPPGQRASYLKTMAQSMPPAQMTAFSRQIGEKDNALGIAAVLTSRDTTKGRNVGEMFLAGRQALDEGRVKLDEKKETGTRAVIFDQLQGVYQTPQATQAAADAVVGVYAKLRAEGMGDGEATQRAIRLVTGGLKDHNGRRIAKPYGWTDDRMDDWLKTQTPETLGAQSFVVNGIKTPAAEIAARLPGATLIPSGDGAYQIQSGADVVRNADGSPYILRMR